MISLTKTKDKKLVAHVHAETGKDRSIDLSNFDVLGDEAFKLLNPIVKSLNCKATESQKGHLSKINMTLGCAIHVWKMSSLPNDENSWQDFVINLYEFVLTNKRSALNLQNRIRYWNYNIAPILELLRDEADVISMGVEIPRTKDNLEKIDVTPYREMLLGEKTEPVTASVNKKLIGPTLLSRTDADYLDQIRNELAYRRSVLSDCLMKWFIQMRQHFNYGQILMRNINWEELNIELKEGRVRQRKPKGKSGCHIASPKTELGLSNLLAILTYDYFGAFGESIKKKSKKIPWAISTLPTSSPSIVSNLVTTPMRLNWMLGNLAPIDIAVMTALLIMHNPSFTPYSLLFSKVRDKQGKPYLELGNKGLLFRIEKARAKSMKEAQLDEVSVDIIGAILEMTAIARKELRNKKNVASEYLFIQHGRGRHYIPAEGHIIKKITGSVKRKDNPGLCLSDFFPSLKKVELDAKNISFKKIRATEAVLEWFRTGSVRAVSRKLGNTKQVAMQYYLPKQLLAAWNTRIIRLYQNLWIVAAAAKEDFLLNVTDFTSIEELNSFIANMLIQHSAASSPLAKELHNSFNKWIQKNELESSPHGTDGQLAIPISKNSLAALYAYQECALASGVAPSVLQKKDRATGFRPNQFILLAELLKNQMPNHKDPSFRKSHEDAVRIVNAMRQSINWADLFVEKGRR